MAAEKPALSSMSDVAPSTKASIGNGSAQPKRVVIIGAGAGGTCLAARLGKMGHEVIVLEKNTYGGGRCSLLTHDGHRWDQGPSLYLMPEIFRDAFTSLGEDLSSYLTLHKCTPAYNMHFADGSTLSLSSDLTEMGAALERFERPAGNEDPLGSFLNFIKEAGENYEESVKHVLTKDWSAWWAFFRPELLPMLWRTGALRIYDTLYSRASRYFASEHIRRAMTFSSMYMGMSPFAAPATYSLLQYAEYAKGVWYPIGGFYRVVEAFERIATEKFGVQFRYGAPVKKIILAGENGGKVEKRRRGMADGVELESGELVQADVVVSNADLVWTYNNLLPSSSYARKLQYKDQTCSSISFYWALKEPVAELGGHNIFLADAYSESFDEIFSQGQLPSEPSFYINVPSRLDPTAAPAGRDTLVVLVPCGPISLDSKSTGPTTREAFEETKKRARRQVIETIQRRLKRPDFESLIEHEIVNDPWDWQERFNLFRGSILGLSHTIPQVLWFRPSIRHASLKNMFFVGASTQPGTGVPVVVAGSGVVASRIDAYLQGRETGWLSWEVARGSLALGLLALGVLALAGIAAGALVVLALLAGALHWLGLVDVPQLVWGRIVPE